MGLNYLRLYKKELFVMLLFVVTLQYFYQTPTEPIRADGIGYYDYLPATFHYHDIYRKHQINTPDQPLYKRINEIGSGVYVKQSKYLVNKYSVGTALLLAPFFIVTYPLYVLFHTEVTCYEQPFQLMVCLAAMVYAFLALLYLRKLLSYYTSNNWVLFFAQLFLLFATPLTWYAHHESSMSHVYSLFAVTAFLYHLKAYFTAPTARHLLYSAFFIGLVILLRQVNVLVLLLVPFIAGSLAQFLNGLKWLVTNLKWLLLALLLTSSLITIQLYFWYIQTGSWIIYSYTNESFYFNNPQFFNILFSYRKGLFVYTPVLLLLFVGLYQWGKSKQYYLLFTWLGAMCVITYVLSSWWSWFYGCSYGLRAYIDFFSILFIPIAIALSEYTYRFALFVFGLMCIPVNLIQTYQYQHYILHWIDMNKDMYRQVFLKTEPQYMGAVWKPTIDYKQYDTLQTILLGNIKVDGSNQHIAKIKVDSLPNLAQTDLLQVSLFNQFNEENSGQVVIAYIDSSSQTVSYYANRSLLHFYEKEFNNLQRGWYNFEVPHAESMGQYLILNYAQSSLPESLYDVRLILFNKRK